MSEKNTSVGVDVDPKAKPLEAGDPIEMPADMGATFAERAKARSKDSKQVDAEDNVEDKAVSSASTKRTARKKS